jgi:FkbM family methyltransferase
MAEAKGFWWALASVPVMIVGALGPWANAFGARVDGPHDEVVLALAVGAASVLLLMPLLGRRWLVLVPLLAGVAAAALTGNDLGDLGDLAPRIGNGLGSVEWGIYLALLGSISLALACGLVLVETTGVVAIGHARIGKARPNIERQWQNLREARSSFFRLARDYSPYIAADREGRVMFVATHDETHESIFRDVPKEERFLRRALEGLDVAGIEVAGTTFLDVGANNGTTSLAALAAGFARVVAFEPGAEPFRLLRANIILNDLEDSITAVNVGLSNRAGTGRIDLGRGSRKAHLYASRDGETHRRAEDVRLARLDDLVDEGLVDPATVGLLWMDVEGHEACVLEGAQAILTADPPAPLVLEVHPKRLRQTQTTQVLKEILPRHYTHLLDLRAKSDRPLFAPIGSLQEVIDSIEERWDATDLLVCRLPY